LTAAAVALAAALAVYAVAIEPWWGARVARRLRATRDPGARVGVYKLILAVDWTHTAVALLAFALSGLAAPDVFLAAPDLGGLGGMIVLGAAVGLLAGAVGGLVAARRGGPAPPTPGDFEALVPRTHRERRWFAAVAVTAGVCEEILYRGVLLAGASLLLPGAPLWALALGLAAVFGLAHLYQGPSGVAATAAVGAMLGVLVAVTGSLLPAIVLHALMDLRVLLLPRP